MTTIEIFESYVSRRAPSNASGARRGYGVTAEAAHEAAGHWANQAPFARTRTVTVCDYERAPSLTTRDERIAWDVCGVPGEYVPATETQTRAAELIRRGRFASAVKLCLGA
jgi:hypothetical protein